jgi:hypothetical protein
MLSTAEAFEKFRKRLELGQTEREDASKRQTDVRECIRGGFDVKTDFLSGSYRRHTKTKPLKDVDVMFVLGDDEKWRREKPPIEMLQAFEKCLKNTFGAEQTEIFLHSPNCRGILLTSQLLIWRRLICLYAPAKLSSCYFFLP